MGEVVSGHSVTHSSASLLRERPLGHWQPETHCMVQKRGLASPHTGGQAVPHRVKTCPVIPHSEGCISITDPVVSGHLIELHLFLWSGE